MLVEVSVGSGWGLLVRDWLVFEVEFEEEVPELRDPVAWVEELT